MQQHKTISFPSAGWTWRDFNSIRHVCANIPNALSTSLLALDNLDEVNGQFDIIM